MMYLIKQIKYIKNGDKMEKIKVPKYTLGEEITNSITHGIGVLLSIAALVLTIIISSTHHNIIGIISSIVYGTTMILMYLISCLYHSMSPNIKAKRVFRIIDHCDIYLYIAGCYTPFCISLIGGSIGWTLFGLVWGCAIIGVLLNAINLEKNKKISLILYLVMGWMVLISIKPLINKLPINGLLLLLAGGIIYTIGAIIYKIGSKKRYFHSVFHVFVLIGSILQFFSILFYTL